MDAIVRERRDEIVALGVKNIVAGRFATCLTGAPFRTPVTAVGQASANDLPVHGEPHAYWFSGRFLAERQRYFISPRRW